MDTRAILSSNGSKQITDWHFWINIWIQNPYNPLPPSLHNTQAMMLWVKQQPIKSRRIKRGGEADIQILHSIASHVVLSLKTSIK